jgi:hypothetical protein
MKRFFLGPALVTVALAAANFDLERDIVKVLKYEDTRWPVFVSSRDTDLATLATMLSGKPDKDEMQVVMRGIKNSQNTMNSMWLTVIYRSLLWENYVKANPTNVTDEQREAMKSVIPRIREAIKERPFSPSQEEVWARAIKIGDLDPAV